MRNSTQQTSLAPWRLQDAKAQFSALVDSAMRGVPQHVTRSGKRAVVVLSELDFEALQRSAASRAHASLNFVEHLLAIPKVAAVDEHDAQRLTVQPRDVDFS
jgi:prevent-host-death family protein